MSSIKVLSLLFINYLTVSPIVADLDCPLKPRGLIAPVFTPIDDNGDLYLDIIPAYAQYLYDNRIDGLIVGGFTGEGPTLSVDEMKTLISAWKTNIRAFDMSITSFIGGRPFPDAVELARYSEDQNLDAIVSAPDLFYRPTTPEELVYATRIIADAAPNTPLLYYDAPRNTEVTVDMAQFTVLATQRIPSFRGVFIDNCDDGFPVQSVLADNQRIFICNSSYLAPAIYLGIDSFSFTEINIFPKLIRSILNNRARGNLKNTNAGFLDLLDVSNTIYSEGQEIPAFKAAMKMLTGLDVGAPRPPEQELSEDQQIDLEQRLRDSGRQIVVPADCN